MPISQSTLLDAVTQTKPARLPSFRSRKRTQIVDDWVNRIMILTDIDRNGAVAGIDRYMKINKLYFW